MFNKLRNRWNSKIDIYKKIYPEATIRQKKHVAKILNDFWLEHEDYLRAIMESLEAKWWPANYVDYICRYVWTYYPRLFEDKYIWNEQWFKNRINSTLRYYSKNWTTKYSWIEIFVSKWKWTGVYWLKDKK